VAGKHEHGITRRARKLYLVKPGLSRGGDTTAAMREWHQDQGELENERKYPIADREPKECKHEPEWAFHTI
jgi:hypothetical protein